MSLGHKTAPQFEARELDRAVANSMGEFDYGAILAEAERSPEIRMTKGKALTFTIDHGLVSPTALEVTCRTSVNDVTGSVMFLLNMTQGQEMVRLPIPGAAIQAFVRQLEALKTTPEARARKARQRLRKRASTPHAFNEHATFKGKCKSCHKGKGTQAHQEGWK